MTTMRRRGRPAIADDEPLMKVAELLFERPKLSVRSAISIIVKANEAAIRRLQRKWKTDGERFKAAVKARSHQNVEPSTHARHPMFDDKLRDQIDRCVSYHQEASQWMKSSFMHEVERVANSSAIRELQNAINSPAAQEMQRVVNSPMMRQLRDAMNSPAMQELQRVANSSPMRELQERVARMKLFGG